MKRLQTDALWTEIDDYLDDCFVPGDDALDAALASSEAAGLPRINVAPNQASCLMLLAQAIGASRILEIGTLGGYSTIWLARGLAPGSKLITLDANAKFAEVARVNIARAGFAEMVELRVGKSERHFAKSRRRAAIRSHLHRRRQGRHAGLFRMGGQAGAPGDADRGGQRRARRRDPRHVSKDSSVQGMRRFFELAATDPRVSGTALQTVGAKGHDGLAILLVTAGR